LTKAQSEKRKVKSESAKRKRVLTPLCHSISQSVRLSVTIRYVYTQVGILEGILRK